MTVQHKIRYIIVSYLVFQAKKFSHEREFRARNTLAHAKEKKKQTDRQRSKKQRVKTRRERWRRRLARFRFPQSRGLVLVKARLLCTKGGRGGRENWTTIILIDCTIIIVIFVAREVIRETARRVLLLIILIIRLVALLVVVLGVVPVIARILQRRQRKRRKSIEGEGGCRVFRQIRSSNRLPLPPLRLQTQTTTITT